MLDVLCPLITESDNVSTQLLDIILINIVEPLKSSRKNAYSLAKDLIIKTSETMEQYITQVSSSDDFNAKPSPLLRIQLNFHSHFLSRFA